MVRQDIMAGLKNALERGYSLEQAQVSLINSGYNQNEINEASNFLTSGVAPVAQQPAVRRAQVPAQPAQQRQPVAQPQPVQRAQVQQPAQVMQPPAQPMPPQRPAQQAQPAKPKKPFPWKIVILVIILLAIIAALVLGFIYRQGIIDFISGLFSS